MSAACPVGPGADSTDTQFRRSGQVQGTWKHKAVIFGGAGGHHRVFPSFWPGCRGFRDTGREAACGRHPGAPGRVTRAHLELEMGSEALGRMGSRGGGRPVCSRPAFSVRGCCPALSRADGAPREREGGLGLRASGWQPSSPSPTSPCSIHNGVIAVFQRKGLPDQELFSLNEGVR